MNEPALPSPSLSAAGGVPSPESVPCTAKVASPELVEVVASAASLDEVTEASQADVPSTGVLEADDSSSPKSDAGEERELSASKTPYRRPQAPPPIITSETPKHTAVARDEVLVPRLPAVVPSAEVTPMPASAEAYPLSARDPCDEPASGIGPPTPLPAMVAEDAGNGNEVE